MKADFRDRLMTAHAGVRRRCGERPRTGIVLGSGLSGIAERFGGVKIPYAEIPGFPVPTVQGHAGVLHLSGKTAVMAGRFHFYEGWGMDEVVLPVFLLHALGVETIILTNAAGGIDSALEPGDLVLISDHLNLLGANPLTGVNDEAFGPRFPDMTEVYSKALRSVAHGRGAGRLKEGVYAALPGPSYETPAEVRMLKRLGADMVGMSTVPEAIAAVYLRMIVLGISCITNFAAGLGGSPLDHREVVETGRRAESELASLLEGVVGSTA